jgi:hypothetical protein
MATSTLPLNTFKTQAFQLTTTNQIIYTAPTGYTAIVLGAQASNYGANDATVTFTLTKSSTDYILLNGFTVPTNDSASVITGKLVIETGCSVKAVASANTTITLVMSILETSNV